MRNIGVLASGSIAGRKRAALLLAGALVGALLTLSCLPGGSRTGQEGDSATSSPAPVLEIAAIPARAQPTPLLAPALEVGRDFLKALAEGRYSASWDLLAAASRQKWVDAEKYSAFLSRKFGPLKMALQAESPAPRQGWRDPETGMRYETAAFLSVRGAIGDRLGEALSLPPLVVVQEEGQWRVAGEGPAARRGPVFPLAQGETQSLAVPILVYHHVASTWPGDSGQRSITVLTGAFEQELAYLQGAGYRSVTLAELANALLYELPLPAKPVVIAFDDGYGDMFTDAFPTLQKYGFVGSFALPTGLIGGAGYLTWEQVKAMSDAGMEFVSHSVNHVGLHLVPEEQAISELRDSRAELEKHLQAPVQILVYPYGEPFANGSPEQQRAVIDLLRREGYALAVTNPLPGTPPVIAQRGDLPYQLQRINVSPGMSIDRFARRLQGTDVR